MNCRSAELTVEISPTELHCKIFMPHFTVLQSAPIRTQPSWFATFAVSALLSLIAGVQQIETTATETNTTQPATTQSATTQLTGSEYVPSKTADIFEIPAELKTYQQLMEYVQEIDRLENDKLSLKEKHAHHQKVARTVVAIAEKSLTLKLQPEQLGSSISLKLQALGYLQKLGEPKAGILLAKAIQQSISDKNSIVRMVGMKHLVESGFNHWADWDPVEQKKWVTKIIKYVQQEETGPFQFDLTIKVVEFLGDVVGGELFAKELLAKALPRFQQSDNPNILSAASKLEGTLRRLNLPGNKIRVQGKQLDGTSLDWSTYRGKVVLIDYWATWCAPCRAEVPNLLNLYDAYHDKGFDVLGISLDVKQEQAEQYIRQEKIPWATLFAEDKSQRGWQHPMAVYYGISGIPRAILVDRDGTVIHMNARGRILAEELRKILGEPVANLPGQRDSLVRQVSNPPLSD